MMYEFYYHLDWHVILQFKVFISKILHLKLSEHG